MSPSAQKLYDYRPDHLITDFRRHLMATNAPHTWRYLSDEPPPRDVPAEVLIPNFIIPSPIADRAPCPLCSPNSPKYRKGHLIWIPSTQTLHAIGHECGDAYFQEGTLGRSVRDANSRATRRELETFILGNWKAPLELSTIAGDVIPRARAYDKVTRSIQSAIAPQVSRAAYRMADEHGFLQVTGAPRPFFGDRALCGHEVLHVIRSNSLEARLQTVTRNLGVVSWHCENEAANWLLEQPDADIRALARSIKDAVPVLNEARIKLAALQEFLDPGNLDLLTRWSEAEYGANRFRVFLHGTDKLTIWRGIERRDVKLAACIWEPLPCALKENFGRAANTY